MYFRNYYLKTCGVATTALSRAERVKIKRQCYTNIRQCQIEYYYSIFTALYNYTCILYN